jgi:hypothetical protein
MVELIPSLRLALLSLLVFIQVLFFTIMNEVGPFTWPLIGGMFALHAAVWYGVRRRPAPNQTQSNADPITSGRAVTSESNQLTDSKNKSRSSPRVISSSHHQSNSSTANQSSHSSQSAKKSIQLINDKFEKNVSRLQQNSSMSSTRKRNNQPNTSTQSCPTPNSRPSRSSRTTQTEPKKIVSESKSNSFAEAAKSIRCKELRERVYLWDELQSCVLLTPGLSSNHQANAASKSKTSLYPPEADKGESVSSNNSHWTSTPCRSIDSKPRLANASSGHETSITDFFINEDIDEPHSIDESSYLKVSTNWSELNQSSSSSKKRDCYAKFCLHSDTSMNSTFDTEPSFASNNCEDASEHLENSELDSDDILRSLKMLNVTDVEEAVEAVEHDSNSISVSEASHLDTSSFHVHSNSNDRSLDAVDHMIHHLQVQAKQNLQLSSLSMEDSVFVPTGQSVSDESWSDQATDYTTNTLDNCVRSTFDASYLPMTPLSPEDVRQPKNAKSADHFVFPDTFASTALLALDVSRLPKNSKELSEQIASASSFTSKSITTPLDSPSPTPVSSAHSHLQSRSASINSSTNLSPSRCSPTADIKRLLVDLCDQIAFTDKLEGIYCSTFFAFWIRLVLIDLFGLICLECERQV